ncbi:MAG: hypothetical protein E6F99_08495 [Actinobacteria bacterium]|nr:MAG: hypothetical protein E6F99_08495 [Actinomycetota bacterium]
MTDLADLIDRYVEVWNEPDDDARRRSIERLWRPDGAHLTPTREAVGYDAIVARISDAYKQFVRDAGYRFRSAGNAVGRRDVAMFNWHMVRPSDDTILAVGFDFFLLDGQRRIQCDYQFTEPPAGDRVVNERAERYVAIWNEPDAQTRRRAVEELWAPDAVHLDSSGEARGRAAIEARAAAMHERLRRERLVARALDNADNAHGGVRFGWELATNGSRAGGGFEFLVFNGDGRIAAGYHFDQ